MAIPGESCSATGLRTFLAEQSQFLNSLDARCNEIEQALANDYARARDAMLRDHAALRKEHDKLREEHEVLRDCLTLSGIVAPQSMHRRASSRRASRLLSTCLEAPQLASCLGALCGMSSARRVCETSRVHGAGMRSCLPALLRSIPRDVYIFGGKNDASPALTTVERFDPSTGEWRSMPPMRSPRYGCAAATVGGRLYVVGGHDGRKALASAERFNPTTSRWESLPPMPTPRSRCAGASIQGQLYVIGGRDSRNSAPTPATERFDPRTGQWEALPPMLLAPLGCTAAVLSGAVYVIGVDADRRMAIGRFDPEGSRWVSLLRGLPRQRFGCAAASEEGALYVFGGHDGSKAIAAAERFDPSRDSGCWESIPPAPTARHGCAAVTSGGHLYLVGGDDEHSLDSFERYDPTTRRWQTLPPLPTGRFGCAVAAAWR